MVRRTFNILGLVFLLVGIGMTIAVGFLVASDFEKTKNGERAEGVVVEAFDNQRPVVEFRTKAGQRLRVEGGISASPTPYRVGERIGVFYDPAQPDQALIDSFLERWFLPLLFGGLATIFTLIGLGFTIAALRRRRKHERLMRSGLRVQGTVAAFEQNRFTKVNGRRPWHVVVDWTDPKGQPRRERSEMLRDDPAKTFEIGDIVSVLMDPNDVNVFWIDVKGIADSVTGGPGSSNSGFGGNTKASSFGKNSGASVVRR